MNDDYVPKHAAPEPKAPKPRRMIDVNGREHDETEWCALATLPCTPKPEPVARAAAHEREAMEAAIKAAISALMRGDQYTAMESVWEAARRYQPPKEAARSDDLTALVARLNDERMAVRAHAAYDAADAITALSEQVETLTRDIAFDVALDECVKTQRATIAAQKAALDRVEALAQRVDTTATIEAGKWSESACFQRGILKAYANVRVALALASKAEAPRRSFIAGEPDPLPDGSLPVAEEPKSPMAAVAEALRRKAASEKAAYEARVAEERDTASDAEPDYSGTLRHDFGADRVCIDCGDTMGKDERPVCPGASDADERCAYLVSSMSHPLRPCGLPRSHWAHDAATANGHPFTPKEQR